MRRILRRAIRFGKEILNAPDNFFHKLVDVVVNKLGDAFPELKVDPHKVISILKNEEKVFQKSFEKVNIFSFFLSFFLLLFFFFFFKIN